MKKKILAFALAAISLVSFTGMAQNTSGATTCANPSKECVKAQKKDRMKKMEVKNRPDRRSRLFEGINLSDAQKTELRELNEKQRADRRQKAEARKECQQRFDSTCKAQCAAERNTCVRSYLDEVKKIIGPDQYVVFLENAYVYGGNGNKAAFGKDKKGTFYKEKKHKMSKDAKYHASRKNKQGKRADKAVSKS